MKVLLYLARAQIELFQQGKSSALDPRQIQLRLRQSHFAENGLLHQLRGL
ncbi:MAG TPA: hypothetical protein PK299_07735 [Anaerolineales bacterium]|nr:hypothetical protein [Anaerolineales bacterium]